HAIGHTLLGGKRRQMDDVVALPPDEPVDDAVSAGLNFAAGRLEQDPDGAYRMTVLRRSRPRGEGPDDVPESIYKVEGVPLRLEGEPDPRTGKPIPRIDLSRRSSR